MKKKTIWARAIPYRDDAGYDRADLWIGTDWTEHEVDASQLAVLEADRWIEVTDKKPVGLEETAPPAETGTDKPVDPIKGGD